MTDSFQPDTDGIHGLQSNLQHLQTRLHSRTRGLLGYERAATTGILVALLEDATGHLQVLFERRAATLRRQPGEISFPGGHIEPMDKTVQDTAVRETSEELGVPRERITVLGPLDVFAPSPKLLVYPFVGFLSRNTTLKPNPEEVDEVLQVPLRVLKTYTPQVFEVTQTPSFPADFPFHLIPGGQDYPWRTATYPQYFYTFNNFVIWGLTARILTHFLSVINGLNLGDMI